jgi:hypothetical protein
LQGELPAGLSVDSKKEMPLAASGDARDQRRQMIEGR